MRFIQIFSSVKLEVRTAHKMKFSIMDFFSMSMCFLRIWSHLLEKFLMENFIFCAVHSPEEEPKLKLTLEKKDGRHLYFVAFL